LLAVAAQVVAWSLPSIRTVAARGVAPGTTDPLQEVVELGEDRRKMNGTILSGPIDTAAWVTIGEHLDREALKLAAEKIRARWAGRYDFQICESPCGKDGFELQLRHR